MLLPPLLLSTLHPLASTFKRRNPLLPPAPLYNFLVVVSAYTNRIVLYEVIKNFGRARAGAFGYEVADVDERVGCGVIGC